MFEDLSGHFLLWAYINRPQIDLITHESSIECYVDINNTSAPLHFAYKNTKSKQNITSESLNM